MLNIRPARPEDVALIGRIGNTSYRHHFAHLWQSAGELEQYLQQEYAVAALERSLADAQCSWLIAESEHPVGFVKYACHQAISPGGPSGALLHKLYLLPDATGRRYGEQLFYAVETRAKEAGEGWLWLEVLAANTSARRFYERLGMEHVKDALFSTATQQSRLHILAKPL
ncbi:GNAT family N-acetyltransferase [Intestinirhabdus alba]|jgi:ribosomal protein S18 acetylase RimI-like enzyme|uniref:GNAT family N-acetyltransferase n=1 Tax=Intestinirhabdus alba TaxID=2899544 RepID=A0A6L6IN87_9ENTR|nr:GNAT family N-acetyltransferase [Intestinirhabdus alba]MTH47959.1 GNAT family N-acetyltransferase [Intestinirhabdus alba]